MNFIINVRAAFDSSASEKGRDSGELASTIITLAGFAVMAILAVNWISTAVLNKASDLSACIEGANVSSTTAAAASNQACTEGDTTVKSYKDDSTYQGRK